MGINKVKTKLGANFQKAVAEEFQMFINVRHNADKIEEKNCSWNQACQLVTNEKQNRM